MEWMEGDENETRQVCETRSNSGKSVREEAFASRRRGLKVPTTNFSRKIKLVLKVYRIGLSRLFPIFHAAQGVGLRNCRVTETRGRSIRLLAVLPISRFSRSLKSSTL